MRRPLTLLIPLCMLIGFSDARAEAINMLTDIGTPFPPGCIALALPDAPASEDEDDYIQTVIDAPSVNSPALDAQVRVTIWRVGCPEPDYSIVMVRLQSLSEREVLVPQVFAQAGRVEQPQHQAQLIPQPAVGNIGASGGYRAIAEEGKTYMLAVAPTGIDGDPDALFLPEHYNDVFTLEMAWTDFSGNAEHFELFEIFSHDPALDAPQFEQPIFSGRHSGSYLVSDHPRTGMLLKVAEFKPGNAMADANFIFVIFFTYTNEGEPLWVVGNSGAEPPQPISELELGMYRPQGGKFFTSPPGSFSEEDVDMELIGSMTLRVVDCNNIEADFDFEKGGFGSGSLEMQRFIRIAGHDCNPWEFH